jgi:hypothetical protein
MSAPAVEWRRVCDIVPAGKRGIAEVLHYQVDELTSLRSLRKAIENDDREFAHVTPGRYASLMMQVADPRDPHYDPVSDGWLCMMSDCPGELRSQEEFIARAHGRVLIAGLGLGTVLPPLLDKPEVSQVVLLEKYQDVIDLVAPHYLGLYEADFNAGRLVIIEADVWQWRPQRGERFNTIWFDIWPERAVGNLREMARLHQRGKHWLDRGDPAAWMGSWYQRELRLQRRRNRYFMAHRERIIEGWLRFGKDDASRRNRYINLAIARLGPEEMRRLLQELIPAVDFSDMQESDVEWWRSFTAKYFEFPVPPGAEEGVRVSVCGGHQSDWERFAPPDLVTSQQEQEVAHGH